MLADFAVTLHPNLGTYFKNNKDMSKIALGTWAWGAGAFGGDAVFGSNTDVENLKPVFEAAMKAGLNLWDTATVYGMGESEKILGAFVAGEKREDVEVSTKFTPQLAEVAWRRWLLLLSSAWVATISTSTGFTTPWMWSAGHLD